MKNECIPPVQQFEVVLIQELQFSQIDSVGLDKERTISVKSSFIMVNLSCIQLKCSFNSNTCNLFCAIHLATKTF